MPTLSFSTFSNGSAASVTNLNEKFYKPDSPTTSLAIVNGVLDTDNVKTGEEFTSEHILPGALTVSKWVSSNATIDYFADLFDTTLSITGTTPSVEDTKTDALPIPGASISFYLPFAPSLVVYLWQIAWNQDGTALGESAVIRFFQGDTAIESERRLSRYTMYQDAGAAAFYHKFQHSLSKWSGHYIDTGVTAGWHTASLRILSTCTQARIYGRSLRVIAFR